MQTKLVLMTLSLSGLVSWLACDALAQDAKRGEAIPDAEVAPLVREHLQLLQGQVRAQRAAQAAGVPMMRIQPARPLNGLQIDLNSLVLAKFDVGPKGAQLVALVEQTRTETQKVTVTAFRQEVKTRKVQVADAEGKLKEVEQQYNVAVPFTQDIDREVQVPVGKKPTAFPFASLRIYRLDGSKVTEAEAKTLLEKTTPVFWLKGFTGDIKPIEGVVLQAINPACLIVVTEPTPVEPGAFPLPANPR